MVDSESKELSFSLSVESIGGGGGGGGVDVGYFFIRLVTLLKVAARDWSALNTFVVSPLPNSSSVRRTSTESSFINPNSIAFFESYRFPVPYQLMLSKPSIY